MVLRLITKAPIRRPRGPLARSKLEALADRMSAAVALDLGRGFTTFRRGISYDDVFAAVHAGKPNRVMEAIPWSKLPEHLEEGMNGVGTALTDGADHAVDTLPGGASRSERKELRLTSDNPKIDQYLNVRTGELVERITDDQQVSIQAAVRRVVDNYVSPRDAANDIKQSIGLNSRQATALSNYTDKLRRDGSDPKEVARLSSEYSARLLDQRAMMIARTEVSYANNQGQLEVWHAAQEQGFLSEKANCVWQVDGDPCPICEDVGGTSVPLGENFDLSNGESVPGPPAHPSCRCILLVGS